MKKANLTNEITQYFEFGKATFLGNISVINSKQLTRGEVEDIAFSTKTPDCIALQFKTILIRATNLMQGNHNTLMDPETGRPVEMPEHRILFILYETGLKIWID